MIGGGQILKVRKQLLQVHHDLQQRIELSIDLIEQLKHEGKSMGEIEQEIVKLTQVKEVYVSVEKILRILDS